VREAVVGAVAVEVEPQLGVVLGRLDHRDHALVRRVARGVALAEGNDVLDELRGERVDLLADGGAGAQVGAARARDPAAARHRGGAADDQDVIAAVVAVVRGVALDDRDAGRRRLAVAVAGRADVRVAVRTGARPRDRAADEVEGLTQVRRVLLVEGRVRVVEVDLVAVFPVVHVDRGVVRPDRERDGRRGRPVRGNGVEDERIGDVDEDVLVERDDVLGVAGRGARGRGEGTQHARDGECGRRDPARVHEASTHIPNHSVHPPPPARHERRPLSGQGIAWRAVVQDLRHRGQY